MKKNNVLTTTSVTDSMVNYWEELCESSKIPRSPEKFLRKFARASRRSLRDMKTIMRAIILEKMKISPSALTLLINELEIMEKTVSQLYDECSHCRLRYRNQLEKVINKAIWYRSQARTVYELEITNKILETIVIETIPGNEPYGSSSEFTVFIPFSVN